jgi:hypothetical protein
MIYFIFYLAAKKRNPLTALQEDEPIPSPAPSSVLQMPFTPGRTPNKNRGMMSKKLICFIFRDLVLCISVDFHQISYIIHFKIKERRVFSK